MPQSLARIVLHIVFSTKDRAPFLREVELRAELYRYMAGILQNLECEPIAINGTSDHVHVLCNFGRKITVAGLIEELKKSPSKWLKEQGRGLSRFYWQGGYGSFSVSESQVEVVRKYVEMQEEHHRKLTFQEEFRALCRKHGVTLDERFAWE